MLKEGYEKVTQVDEDPHESLPEEDNSRYVKRASIVFCVVFFVSILSLQIVLQRGHHVRTVTFTKEELLVLNMQDRAQVNLGNPKNGFSNVNLDNKERRIRDMKDLDKVRVEHCGNVLGSSWRQTGDLVKVQYIPNTVEYSKWASMAYNPISAHRAQGKDKANITNYNVERRICEGAHPRLLDTTVTIERLGPFRSHGGYDWNTVLFTTLGGFQKNKTVYLLGRMFGTVDADGKPYNYPPFHVHHVHGYPYEYTQGMVAKLIPEQYKLLRDGDFSDHHVMIQGHGDTICKEEEGGTACLLDQLPDGQGYRIVNSSGFPFNFEVNDVRPPGSPRMEFYVDVAFIHTEKRLVETTFMQMGNPSIGVGWRTYLYPLEPHTNMFYYNYTNVMLGPGTMNNFLLHTHMVSFDSIYVFKGDNVYPTLEKYRLQNKGELPYIFECRDQEPQTEISNILKLVSGKFVMNLFTTQELNQLLESPGTELVCEATKPSLVYDCQDAGDRCTYRDKRISYNCRKDVRLEPNEVIVVLAFNTVRNTSTTALSRKSPLSEIVVTSPFGMGYAAHQHSIFRADFVSDRAQAGLINPGRENASEDVKYGAYAPPAVFRFASLPVRQSPHSGPNVVTAPVNRMIENCNVPISFKSSLPWEVEGLN